MIPGAIKTVTRGTCVECGRVGFLGDMVCKDCIQRRAEAEHFAPATVNKTSGSPVVVKIKKQWS